MKPSVYIENSVISYLTSRRSKKNLRVAAQQDITREWWDTRRQEFQLFVSVVVAEEAREGAPGTAAARLKVIAGIEIWRLPAKRENWRLLCSDAHRERGYTSRCRSRVPTERF